MFASIHTPTANRTRSEPDSPTSTTGLTGPFAGKMVAPGEVTVRRTVDVATSSAASAQSVAQWRSSAGSIRNAVRSESPKSRGRNSPTYSPPDNHRDGVVVARSAHTLRIRDSFGGASGKNCDTRMNPTSAAAKAPTARGTVLPLMKTSFSHYRSHGRRGR